MVIQEPRRNDLTLKGELSKSESTQGGKNQSIGAKRVPCQNERSPINYLEQVDLQLVCKGGWCKQNFVNFLNF